MVLLEIPGFGSSSESQSGCVTGALGEQWIPWIVLTLWCSLCSLCSQNQLLCISCPYPDTVAPVGALLIRTTAVSFPGNGNIPSGSCRNQSLSVNSTRAVRASQFSSITLRSFAFTLLVTTQGWHSTFCFSCRAFCKLWNFCWGGITDPAALSMLALATMRRYFLSFPWNNNLFALFL